MAASQADFDAIDKELLEICVDFVTRWEEDYSDLFTRFDIESNFRKHSEEHNKVFRKIEKSSIDIVVIGKTSSGKSLTVNNLIGGDFMKSGFGDTTPTAVWIQTTTEPKSYFQLGDDEKRYINFADKDELDNFHDMVDRNSDGNLQTDECIELFISKSILKENCIISNEVAILDTPGMERDAFKKESITNRIREADAVILIVGIDTWSDNEGIRRLLNDPSYFVRPNVIVAINKCDALMEQEPNPKRREKMKNNIKKELSELAAFEDEKIQKNDESIFFISAKFISGGKASFNQEQATDDQDVLVEEFRRFERTILSMAQINCKIKKTERINDAIVRSKNDLVNDLHLICIRVDDVKDALSTLNLHIAASTNNIQKFVNRQFVKKGFIHESFDLKSKCGKDKVLAFLEYCRAEGFEDIKSAIIQDKPVDLRIQKLFNKIVKEEIKRITNTESNRLVEAFHMLLEPAHFDGSLYNRELSEIEKKKDEVWAAFQKSCIDRKNKLDKELKAFKEQKEKEKKDSLNDLESKINNIREKRKKVKASCWPSSAELLNLKEQKHNLQNQYHQNTKIFDAEIESNSERNRELLDNFESSERSKLGDQYERYYEKQCIAIFESVIRFVSEGVQMCLEKDVDYLKEVKLKNDIDSLFKLTE